MSISSDGIEVDDSWRVDLEIALLEDADFFKIRTICANRPVPANTRAEVWRICLQPELQAQGMTDFADVFGLKNQHQLHADCEQAAKEAIDHLTAQFSSSERAVPRSAFSDSDGDDLDSALVGEDHKFDFGRDSEPNHMPSIPSVAQLTSDFESVLTHFAQTYSLDYSSDNGWVSILRVLYCTLKPLDKHDLYACFASVYHRFVPNGPDVVTRMCLVFRLLFQYHEPELCNLLESLKITPDLYSRTWLFHLFSTAVSHTTLLALWDVYFLMADPLLGLFIVLVLLINAKASLMESTGSNHPADNETIEPTEEGTPPRTLDRDEVLQMLSDLPKPMEANDITSLIELTQLFAARTPHSFRAEFLPVLFGNTIPDVEDGRSSLRSAPLCLSVSVQEVLEAQASALNSTHNVASDLPAATTEPKPPIRFLLVDCRPADQYNAGHLTTAFFMDSQLLLSDPDSFQTTVNALLQSQRRALNAGSYAAGEHITFLSSGRPEEDQIANMVVAAFLRLNTPYVSLIKGGYAALHDALGPQLMGRSLVNHDPKECLSCRAHPTRKDNIVMGLLKSSAKSLKQDSSPVINQQSQSASSTSKLGTAGGKFFSKLSGTLFKSNLGLGMGSGAQISVNAQGMEKRVPVSSTNSTNTPRSSVRPAVSSTSERPPMETARSTSYRNTASVFSIDDDMDDDDFSQPEDGSMTVSEDTEPYSGSSANTSMETKTEQTSSKRTSWLKRFAAVINVGESDSLPSGDIPTRSAGLDSSEPGDLIDTTQWSCRPEVHGVFDCQFIDPYGRLAELGYLVLVERHLLVLRDRTPRSPGRLVSSLGSVIQSALGRGTVTETPSGARISTRSRHAIVLRSAPLALITRITSNRRLPECITFHYSGVDPADSLRLNEQVMGIRDRLYLPQAGEAVRMIKMAIYNVTMA